MIMRNVFAFVILVSLVWKSNALTCYSCDAINTGNCFNISQYSESIGRCSSEPTSFRSQIQQASGSYEEIDTRAVNTKCVVYQQYYYLRNTTEIHRGCVASQYADSLCDSLVTNSQLYYYNLTRCRVCQEDFCNSGYRYNVMALVLLLGVLVSASVA